MLPIKRGVPPDHFRNRPSEFAIPDQVPAPTMNPFQKGAAPHSGYYARPPIGSGPPAPIMNGPPQSKPSGVSQVISKFKTPEGQLDIEKITTTAQQVHKIYNDLSPMVSQFLKNR